MGIPPADVDFATTATPEQMKEQLYLIFRLFVTTECHCVEGGEEGQPQQFLARVTFSSFSRPSHL